MSDDREVPDGTETPALPGTFEDFERQFWPTFVREALAAARRSYERGEVPRVVFIAHDGFAARHLAIYRNAGWDETRMILAEAIEETYALQAGLARSQWSRTLGVDPEGHVEEWER